MRVRVWLGLFLALLPVHARADTVSQDVPDLVTQAAAAHGVSPGWLRSVASCESKFNRYAVNGTHLGLFQLGPALRLEFASRGYDDVWDPAQQANYAAELFSERRSSNWVQCGG